MEIIIRTEVCSEFSVAHVHYLLPRFDLSGTS